MLDMTSDSLIFRSCAKFFKWLTVACGACMLAGSAEFGSLGPLRPGSGTLVAALYAPNLDPLSSYGPALNTPVAAFWGMQMMLSCSLASSSSLEREWLSGQLASQFAACIWPIRA